MIGIPDFTGGALEHWGMISLRESVLLFLNATHSSSVITTTTAQSTTITSSISTSSSTTNSSSTTGSSTTTESFSTDDSSLTTDSIKNTIVHKIKNKYESDFKFVNLDSTELGQTVAMTIAHELAHFVIKLESLNHSVVLE